MKIIDRECAGEKTDLGIAVVSYRKYEPLEVIDPATALQWLQENNHPECIKVTTEVRKTETKALVKRGNAVPGTVLAPKNNCSLK